MREPAISRRVPAFINEVSPSSKAAAARSGHHNEDDDFKEDKVGEESIRPRPSRSRVFVDQAESMEELSGLLRLVDLQKIKDLINAELETIDHDLSSAVCIRSSPIDLVLSNDAIQSILAFIPFQGSNKLISKNINALVAKNERALQCTQSDWDRVIQSKRYEIEVFERRKIEEMGSVQRKYEDAIQRARFDVERMLCGQEKNDSSVLYCRQCVAGMKVGEVMECNDCAIRECVECIEGCDECADVYCSGCALREFTTTRCGAKLCEGCLYHHDKECGCHSRYW